MVPGASIGMNDQGMSADGRALHVVGAGVAGLAAAVAGVRAGLGVALHEAAGQAGGRCRSFHDATLDRLIDNGNHLIVGANQSVFGYLADIGAPDALSPLDPPRFDFLDATNGETWTLQPKDGFLPFWLLGKQGRVPGGGVGDLIDAGRLAFASPDATIADCVDTDGPLFERFWQPLSRAVLNTDATEGSARLLWRMVRKTFAKGAAGSRPYLADKGLSAALVEPALTYLGGRGVTAVFNERLRGLRISDARVTGLDFGDRTVGAGNAQVVLALPPSEIARLLPDVRVPGETRPIVNLHYRLDGEAVLPGGGAFLGLVGTEAQWIFRRGDILSVTISAATGMAAKPAGAVAETIWRELAPILDRPGAPVPPCRVIKEQRATIAQTPAQAALRPGPATGIDNLWLAGDWTDTGLPATIDGAVQSGREAVKRALSAGFRAVPD